ncbi:hypothetical protein J437_LFUL005287 [Ladona fulva]|uniref:Uncharacterized protein n=1 Tax=Ladona fulva TaxID=123851 RepID=A0A8K0K1K5_LADFU|nr:hypothetical protein J437_LFUL005287 [Ladona fulva]
MYSMPVSSQQKAYMVSSIWSLNSRNHTGINEEIIWVSIGMGITIALLITIALCYILREKCRSNRRPHEYYITA